MGTNILTPGNAIELPIDILDLPPMSRPVRGPVVPTMHRLENADGPHRRTIVGYAPPAPSNGVAAHDVDGEKSNRERAGFVSFAVDNGLLAFIRHALQCGSVLAGEGVERLGRDVGAVGDELVGDGGVEIGADVVDEAVDEVRGVGVSEALAGCECAGAAEEESGAEEAHLGWGAGY